MVGALIFAVTMLISSWLQEGISAYYNADFIKSISILEEGIGRTKTPDSIRVKALPFLAASYFAIGSKVKTKYYLEDLIKLDPLAKISIEVFPPKFVDIFENIRRKYLTELKIIVQPQNVYVEISTRFSTDTLGTIKDSVKVNLVKTITPNSKYKLIFKCERFYPETIPLSLKKEETIWINLNPIMGKLYIQSIPDSATVTIVETNKSCITPCDLYLQIGSYTLLVSKPPIYEDINKKVEVVEDSITKVDLKLNPSQEFLNFKQNLKKEWQEKINLRRKRSKKIRLFSFVTLALSGATLVLSNHFYSEYKKTMDPGRIRTLKSRVKLLDAVTLVELLTSVTSFVVSLGLNIKPREPDYEKEFLKYKGYQ
jgi:hypothetical protein